MALVGTEELQGKEFKYVKCEFSKTEKPFCKYTKLGSLMQSTGTVHCNKQLFFFFVLIFLTWSVWSRTKIHWHKKEVFIRNSAFIKECSAGFTDTVIKNCMCTCTDFELCDTCAIPDTAT